MAYNAKIRDVACELSLKDDTVYRYVRDNYIPHLRIGRGSRQVIRFDMQEVREWVQAKRHEGRTERLPVVG
jgi:excisionase family DNA binding protein